jgi:hypothetical protein
MMDADPVGNSIKILFKNMRIQKIALVVPEKWLILQSLAYAYQNNISESLKIVRTLIDEKERKQLYRADACFAVCYSYFRGKEKEDWE